MSENWFEILQQAPAVVAAWIESVVSEISIFGEGEQLAVMTFMLLGMVTITIIFMLALRAAKKNQPDSADGLKDLTRGPRTLGYLVGLVLIFVFGAWALVAPLASAALAPGVVSPDGYRKTVQHLEGGIIHGIHVEEGDVVEAGEVLVTLNDTQARAHYLELQERLVYFLAVEARLLAEQSGADDIVFPPMLTDLDDAAARQAMEGQRNLLDSRRATMTGREQILAQRVKQLEEENKGIHQMIASQKKQISLIDREIAGVQELYDKGLERLPRLLALQRAKAEIQGSRAGNRAQIARNEQRIGETDFQLLTIREQHREKVNEELASVRTALGELRSRVSSRADVLDRTLITAPISGTVMNLRVTTEAGVIGSGQPILDIVPRQGKLIIDAQIKPTDIDNVEPGMKARVILTAYRQRNLPRIYGVLRSVSADRLIEDHSGEAYFLAKVEVDAENLAKLKDVRMIAGMPAEVMILNRERTFFDYLMQPLKESLDKSFREN